MTQKSVGACLLIWPPLAFPNPNPNPHSNPYHPGAGHTTEVMVDTIITAKRPSAPGADDAGFVMSSRCALPYQTSGAGAPARAPVPAPLPEPALAPMLTPFGCSPWGHQA